MNGLLTAITNVNNAVNGVVWGVPALVLLAFVGVLMTVLTKVFQVTHFGHWMKKTIGAVFRDKHVTSHTRDKSISSSRACAPPWRPRSEPAISSAFPARSSPAAPAPCSGCGSWPSWA